MVCLHYLVSCIAHHLGEEGLAVIYKMRPPVTAMAHLANEHLLISITYGMASELPLAVLVKVLFQLATAWAECVDLQNTGNHVAYCQLTTQCLVKNNHIVLCFRHVEAMCQAVQQLSVWKADMCC